LEVTYLEEFEKASSLFSLGRYKEERFGKLSTDRDFAGERDQDSAVVGAPDDAGLG